MYTQYIDYYIIIIINIQNKTQPEIKILTLNDRVAPEVFSLFTQGMRCASFNFRYYL